MKKLLSTFLLSIIVSLTYAQDKKFSATAAFPFAVGDFDYTGLVDLGLQYRFVTLGPIALGASANVGYLNKNENLGTIDGNTRVLLIEPKVHGELNLASLVKLKPFLGLGYSWANFKSEIGPSSQKETDGGLSFNLGAAYDINDVFFIHLQFDSTRFPSKEIAIGNLIAATRQASSLNIIKLGVGLRF